MKVVSAWTNENVELLRKWWGKGDTATHISNSFQELGFNITRNAVIGKVHRLGLERDEEARKKVQRARKPRVRSATSPISRFLVHRNVTVNIRNHAIPNQKEPDMIKAPDPNKQVLLIDTTDGQCREIVAYRNGELGQAICCGETTPWVYNEREHKLARSSWCEHHREINIKRDSK